MSKQDRAISMEFAKLDWHNWIKKGYTWKAAREEIEKDYEFTDEEKIKFRWWLVGIMESYQEAGAVK
ncbi:hypothetical protein [Marinilactibacillus psychrotolerans]|uniref:hypothetical protein n=1 Tax=Marinilactibacillus psychrotolerans TaxID=191770 RepID=UPI0039AF59E7